jgi:tRNA modification GTPase
VERLLRVTAHLEAYIDFPDEDLPAEDVTGPLSELADLQRDIDRLSATEKYRNRLQDGISIVLLGAPNAGKSSLLNQLVSDERAIVSEEAGTTRDYIEVRGILGGHLVRYIDTAGLRSTVSKIEAAGVAKSLHMAQKADLVLHVVDCQASELPMESEVAAVLSEKPSITVLNKSDLLNASSSASIAEGSIAVSALTGAGMESLIDTMANFLDADFRVPDDADVAVSARHAAALNTVKEHLGAAVGQLRDGISVELAATELHMAIDSMGLIVGRIDNEQMLDELFGSFCIGK